MYLMFDMKNGVECLATLPLQCECCDVQASHLCNSDCSEYPAFLDGVNVTYKGNIGSCLMEMLSMDLDVLERQIDTDCKNTTNEKKHSDFEEWFEQFDIQQQKFGVNDMFLRKALQPFYKVWYRLIRSAFRDKDNQVKSGGVIQPFTVFECVKIYIDGCLIDSALYDPEKYKFVSNFFLIPEPEDFQPISKLELSYGKIFHQILKSDLSSETFLSDIKTEYENRTSEINPLFIGYDEIYEARDINAFAVISLKKILDAGFRFKICENCGLPFIPYNRTDTKYCDRASPQDRSKTCKEYGARHTWQETLKKDEATRLCRNIYMSKQMLAKRNPDISEYQESFNRFKSESKGWKADYKAGRKTSEEFILWLKDMKEKKVL